MLADAAKLAFIIGAFMAGLAIGRSGHHERVAADLNSVGDVFIPVFFVLIGIERRPRRRCSARAASSIAACLFVVAVAGKLVSGLGGVGVARPTAC